MPQDPAFAEAPRSTPAGRGPAWMAWCLRVAGVYNLAWGAVMIIAPVWSLGVLGVRPVGSEVWPELWGCIGMIVGVYGIGYLLAAAAPLRHWPITLVGLLGKVLGPIGFLDAAMRDRLPWSMGWTIITNDLMWWIPFSMILLHARREHLSSRRGQFPASH